MNWKKNKDQKKILTKGEVVLLTRMFFGKHKGEFFKDIPKDYLQRLLGTDDLDEDLKFTVGHYLTNQEIQKLLFRGVLFEKQHY